MFVYPPLPPKDFTLREVSKNYLSSAQFTPTQEPRVTLPSIGQHCVPVEAGIADPAPYQPYAEVNPKVVSAWVERVKEDWVGRPGEDAYLLHEMHKKYNVVVCDSYDARYIHRFPVFPRSFKYEMDCLKEYQQQKLETKIVRDEEAERRERPGPETREEDEMPKHPESIYKSSYVRWQEEPALFAPSQADPCKRRAEFSLVGQPFQNDACKWYYENYPPPKLGWCKQRFA